MEPRSLGACRGGHLSQAERARHAILVLRLQRPYLLYCFVCTVVTAFLLGWNFSKGVQNNWNLPQWKHHYWEEVLEVGVGACMAAETFLTMRVLGVRTFFRSCWCVFDFVAMLLTVVSICYGLKHLGRRGEICEADVPLLMLRFVLQPMRMFTALTSTCRTHKMQSQIDDLQVDFNLLTANDCGVELSSALG